MKITSTSGNTFTDDEVIGLYVDMRNLKVESTDGLSNEQVGSKYSALFTGGVVEIISTGDSIGRASANLFVRHHGISDQTYTVQNDDTVLYPDHLLSLSKDGGLTTETVVIPASRTIDLNGLFGGLGYNSIVATINNNENDLQAALLALYDDNSENWVVNVSTPNQITENMAFQVDRTLPSGTTINALAVDAKGYVSVGSSTPNSRFYIEGVSGGAESLFEIVDQDSVQYFLAQRTGIGIGVDPTDADLTVGGSVSGNYGVFSGLSLVGCKTSVL